MVENNPQSVYKEKLIENNRIDSLIKLTELFKKKSAQSENDPLL